MRGKILLGVIVLFFFAGSTQAWDTRIINIPGFTKNHVDTHMYWDGTYLWIPETEYEVCPLDIISHNLIRYNPLTAEVTNYSLPIFIHLLLKNQFYIP